MYLHSRSWQLLRSYTEIFNLPYTHNQIVVSERSMRRYMIWSRAHGMCGHRIYLCGYVIEEVASNIQFIYGCLPIYHFKNCFRWHSLILRTSGNPRTFRLLLVCLLAPTKCFSSFGSFYSWIRWLGGGKGMWTRSTRGSRAPVKFRGGPATCL